MRLLVTGAAGMLGRDVVVSAQDAGHEVVALGHAELDIADGAEAARVLGDERPDAVVNCAAYTDVDGAESAPELAAAVNEAGAGHVARAADAVGATVVHVSTDYVFDGRAGRPYVESDAPAPLSVYGTTKLGGERAVAAAAARHAIVRTSWLHGTGGSNFVELMLRLARKRAVARAAEDQVGSPTWTGHLAPALIALAASDHYGIHHVGGAGACSRYDFARQIYRAAGVDREVVPVGWEAFARPAARPPFSALASERADTPRLPPWEEGLAAHLRETASPAGRRAAESP